MRSTPPATGAFATSPPGGLDWSEEEIAYHLGTGFTPEFDTAGSKMAVLVSELAKLPDASRAAIAAYLRTVPPIEPVAKWSGAGFAYLQNVTSQAPRRAKRAARSCAKSSPAW